MKRFRLLVAAAAVIAVSTAPALAADAAVSVTIGQPGYFGRIDINGYPQPRLVYAEPIVIQSAPVVVATEPIYLRVPPGHAKDWRKHCRKYDACGQRVYFVQDAWYTNVYVPQYRDKHAEKQVKKQQKEQKKQDKKQDKKDN